MPGFCFHHDQASCAHYIAKRIMFQVVLHSTAIHDKQKLCFVVESLLGYTPFLHGHTVDHDKCKGDKIS